MKRPPFVPSVLRFLSSVFRESTVALCAGGWLLSSVSALAADIPAGLFAYDRSAPFNVQEAGRETRGAALVRDLTFTPADKPVKAYLVSPAAGPGPHAAILFVHWLGEPATTNRTQFLDEAVALAGRGVVSLLVEGMWAEPDWYKNRIPEEDYAHAIRQVIELRRAMDLLLAQPGIDSTRVALVGHDFGAMYGMMAEALDRRARTCVFMAPTPHFEDWFLFRQQPRDLAAYKAQLAAIDPVLFVPRLAPASVFFQFADKDFYVTAGEAAEFYAAAGPRKHMATYAADHDLHPPEVAADRVAWLVRELELK
jgi:pimeloyl-ACP methyl ester carboxylesterase